MTKSLSFFLFFSFLFLFAKGNAQCVQVLTNEPLEVCSGGGTMVNILTEGDFLAVEWSPNLGMDNANILNPTFLNPVDTTYLLTLKGLDKETKDTCETIAFIEIKTVQFDLILPQDTVELPCGDSIRLSAQVLPSESYFLTKWSTTTGNFLQGNQVLNPLIDATGIYELSAIGTLGRIVCEARDSLAVVYVNDNVLSITPPENLHCNQSFLTLSIANVDTTNSFLYNWVTIDGSFASQADQAVVVVDKEGAYSVTRTDLFGECAVSQRVRVESLVFEDFDLAISQPTCEKPTGTINIGEIVGGQAPYRYSTDNGATFQTSKEFSDLLGGKYAVLVRDANDCEIVKEATIADFPSFELSLIATATIERGSEFSLPLIIKNQGIGIESIKWQPAFGLSCTDCPNPLLIDFRSTEYQVIVRGNNGCEQMATIDMRITQPNLFYAPTIFSPNNDGQNDVFTIFPNQKITEALAELAIFDRYGNLVFQKMADSNYLNNSWDGKYRGKDMPNGTYLYWGEITLSNGKVERINGTINLVR